MLRRKCSSPKTRPLHQLLEVELNRDETCQSLNPTSGGGAKCTQDPEGSLVLHGCQERDLRLSGRSSKEPEAKAIGRNRDYTEAVEELFLQGKQTTSRVAKYAHCLHSGQGLGGVEANVFFERETSIKVEAQVSPVSLGLEGRGTNS